MPILKLSKKIVKRNKKEYERLADHIGQYPVVFISPYDGDLIAEGSELRRRWMDGILVQIDREKLHIVEANPVAGPLSYHQRLCSCMLAARRTPPRTGRGSFLVRGRRTGTG